MKESIKPYSIKGDTKRVPRDRGIEGDIEGFDRPLTQSEVDALPGIVKSAFGLSNERMINAEVAVGIYQKKKLTALQTIFLLAQIRQESNFNASAVSTAGAQGLAQAMPNTWPDMMKTKDDPFDPVKSIQFQVKYMDWLIKYVEKETSLTDLQYWSRPVLYAYNWGPGNAVRYFNEGMSDPVNPETSDYYPNVWAHATQIAKRLKTGASVVSEQTSNSTQGES